MSARELIDDRALEDEEEDDESFDEETGDVRARPNGANNRFEDSSEEDEEDDDDEEAAAEVGAFTLEPSQTHVLTCTVT
jgi:transcription elongation factor SPT6